MLKYIMGEFLSSAREAVAKTFRRWSERSRDADNSAEFIGRAPEESSQASTSPGRGELFGKWNKPHWLDPRSLGRRDELRNRYPRE